MTTLWHVFPVPLAPFVALAALAGLFAGAG